MEKLTDLLARKSPQFNTASPQMPVSDALYRMCCENIDFLIVLDEDDRFRGVLSDHDIASRILFEERPLKEIKVSEFMNKTLPVATPDTTLQGCIQLLERFGARHAAVYDRFNFCGVVSERDLMQEAVHNRELFAEAGEPRHGYPWNY